MTNSLRFWYYASLSTYCQNLEKNWGHWENLGESKGQTFNGSDQVSISVLWQLPVSAFFYFWWRGSINKISPIGEKKNSWSQKKTQENNNFLMNQFHFLSPDFIRGSTVVVIHHDVDLCIVCSFWSCALFFNASVITVISWNSLAEKWPCHERN